MQGTISRDSVMGSKWGFQVIHEMKLIEHRKVTWRVCVFVCVCVCVCVCPVMMASFVRGRGEAHDRRHHPALKALTKESLRRAG